MKLLVLQAIEPLIQDVMSLMAAAALARQPDSALCCPALVLHSQPQGCYQKPVQGCLVQSSCTGARPCKSSNACEKLESCGYSGAAARPEHDITYQTLDCCRRLLMS